MLPIVLIILAAATCLPPPCLDPGSPASPTGCHPSSTFARAEVLDEEVLDEEVLPTHLIGTHSSRHDPVLVIATVLISVAITILTLRELWRRHRARRSETPPCRPPNQARRVGKYALFVIGLLLLLGTLLPSTLQTWSVVADTLFGVGELLFGAAAATWVGAALLWTVSWLRLAATKQGWYALAALGCALVALGCSGSCLVCLALG